MEAREAITSDARAQLVLTDVPADEPEGGDAAACPWRSPGEVARLCQHLPADVAAALGRRGPVRMAPGAYPK